MQEHGLFWERGPRAGMKIVFPPGQSFGVALGSAGMIDFGVDFILREKSDSCTYFYVTYDEKEGRYLAIFDELGPFYYVEPHEIIEFENGEAISLL